jgi:hypothetical protein
MQHACNMIDDDPDLDFLAWAKTNASPRDSEDWAKALDDARKQCQRRMLRKEILHFIVRKFVAAYLAEANPDTPNTDTSDQERKDLIRGANLKTSLREKWAMRRAIEQYQRDDRTIREAVKPSRRSRPRTKRTKR